MLTPIWRQDGANVRFYMAQLGDRLSAEASMGDGPVSHSGGAQPRFTLRQGPSIVAPNLNTVRVLPERLSGLSVFHSQSVIYGTFEWVRRALNIQKRRFPARAVYEDSRDADGRPAGLFWLPEALRGREGPDLHLRGAGHEQSPCRLDGHPATDEQHHAHGAFHIRHTLQFPRGS